MKASGAMRSGHNSGGNSGPWLDPGESVEDPKAMLLPFPADQMIEEQVSTLVNSPKNEGPKLLSA